jgi:hypothetical protein
MAVQTPGNLQLPSLPTAKIAFTASCRQQMPGLDEFDLEAAGDARALTGAGKARSRARKAITELKETGNGGWKSK